MSDEFLAMAQLQTVETHMATDLSVVEQQIQENLLRKLTEIETLPEWSKNKADEPFAIVGGGPSLKYTLEILRPFKTIIVAGSSHDYLIERGVKPTYALVIDPDPASANYLKHPSPTCTYLVASCCHPKVFEALEGYPVARWHAAGPEVEWLVQAWKNSGMSDAGIKGKPIIGGGCTAGTRCISIGLLLGYKNIHLFGMDSSLDPNDNRHHAYDFVDPENEHLGDIVQLRLGHPTQGRLFYCAKYMMAQLWGFRNFMATYGHTCRITIHGDGILSELLRMGEFDREKLDKLQDAHAQAA